jgi:CubicO group peptidase (beta-lactamase class C family)
VLGAIIEEVTGQPYLSYCRNAVLAPLGITGDFEPDWQVMGSYGAWRMTADGYLRILDLFAATDQRLGTVANKWMLSSEGKKVIPNSPVWLGLGTNVNKAADGVMVWQWGAWQYNLAGAKDGVLKASFVTYAARMNDGTAWFVYATPHVEDGTPRVELDSALFGAYRTVKSWNLQLQ